MAMPDTREKLNGQGVEPFFSGSEQFTAMMKTDIDKFAKVIRTANIRMEN
jgi:tripartite-type tricarboxylate transporter receptor subunit TctC